MSRKPKALIIGAIIAGAFLLGGIAVPLTSAPKFCATCHTIRPSYESWAMSSHKDVTCVDCHVRPGLGGFIEDKALAGTKDVLITLFGTPDAPHDLHATVHNEVCLDCHRAILRVSEVAARDLPSPVKEVGLIMSHRMHMEAFDKRGKGEGCTTCHSQVVHGQPIKGYPIVIPRGHVDADSKPHYPDYPEGSRLRKAALADCFRCHDNKTTYQGEIVSQKCDLCHLPDKISESLLF